MFNNFQKLILKFLNQTLIVTSILIPIVLVQLLYVSILYKYYNKNF